MDHVVVGHCSYDMPNQLLFDYHVFTAVTMLPVATLLLYNTSLRRLYLPLARLVNASLVARLISIFLFFVSYPYPRGTSNCPEILLSKLTTLIEMFAELHQVYFIGFVLGIGNFNACMTRYFSLSLVRLLQTAFAVMLLSIAVSVFFFRGSLSFVEDSCTVFVALMQLYVIRVAENVREDHVGNCLISVKDTAISIFKSLSVIQLFLSVTSLSFRLLLSTLSDEVINSEEMSWVGSIKDAASIVMAIDFFSTYMFYIKVILVREKSKNIVVDIVPV